MHNSILIYNFIFVRVNINQFSVKLHASHIEQKVKKSQNYKMLDVRMDLWRSFGPKHLLK